MEPQSNPSGDASESTPHSSQSSGSGGARSTANPLREAIFRAWECGAEDARRTARESIPRARQAAGELATDLAYGLGYGASFAATLLDHFGAKDAGFSSERGMQAGRHAAEEIIRRFGQRTPPPSSPHPEEAPQSAP